MYFLYQGMHLIDRCFKCSVLLGFTQDGLLLSFKIFRAVIMKNGMQISHRHHVEILMLCYNFFAATRSVSSMHSLLSLTGYDKL